MRLESGKIILIAAAVLLLICSPAASQSDYSGQWPVSIFPTESPAGSVKTITESAFTITEENGVLQRVQKYTLVLRYSREGLLETEEYFTPDGSHANRVDYTYENGFLTLKTQTYPNTNHPDREIFTVTSDGKIIEAEKIFSAGNYGWKYRNSYDNHGRIVLTSKYDRFWKWKLVYSRIFEYNDEGQLSATEGFGMDTELLWRDEHVYDAKGRVVETVKYNPDKELVVKIINEYNDAGDFIRREFFDHNGTAYAVYTYGWNYDEYGNWITKVTGRETQGGGTEYLQPDSMVSRDIEYF